MNPVEEYLGRLAKAQQARVAALWAQVGDGTVTVDEFVLMAENVVLAGNATGYALGTLTVRDAVEVGTAAPQITALAANAHHLDRGRVTDALRTILDAQETDTLMQLTRLADNEPKQAAADGAADVIRSNGAVTGWRRSLNSTACQLCRWWSREGRVWPAEHPMPRHTGCTCTQEPITKESTAA